MVPPPTTVINQNLCLTSKTETGCKNPLFKIQPVSFDGVLSKNLKLCWKAGQKICIDGSMILYKGQAIAFGQIHASKAYKAWH
jgi:hypothetical protein